MDTREIYKRFLLKINKNDTNDGIAIPVSHFVLMFNTEALLWLGEKLKTDGDNVKLNDLRNLYRPDLKLPLSEKFDTSIEYKISENVYRFISSFSIASRGGCKGVRINNFDKKPLFQTTFQADEYSKPSLDYEEAPCILGNGVLKVFKGEDYDLTDTYLSYYKAPDKINIEGYIQIDGTPSVNQTTDLSELNIDEVLNRLSAEVTRQSENAEGNQFAQQRIQTEP